MRAGLPEGNGITEEKEMGFRGTGKHRNFVVTYHVKDSGHTECLGVYKKWTTAMGVIYNHVTNMQDMENESKKGLYHLGFPYPMQDDKAFRIDVSYMETGSDEVSDSDYYLIYDNRKDKRATWLRKKKRKNRKKIWESEQHDLAREYRETDNSKTADDEE